MTSEHHPELAAEQAYIDRAYEALEEMRRRAERLRDDALSHDRGGTHAARYERDVFIRTSLHRLERLELGRESLVFGRTDHLDGETYYVGRLAVSGPEREPLVIDWRAPAAEPFYRATGLHPMGLHRRRHLICESQHLTRVEDETFGGEGAIGIAGEGALIAALERARTGRMRDIVSTIQREQDEIIRAPLPGILVVQGGPGTGKTAVALHRAAYLLFTHRYRLERDGVLVVGPNQLFLRYIDHVLPALGESGVALSTIDGLVEGLRVRATEEPEVARLKGDPRMARVIRRAVQDRQRPLREEVTVRIGEHDITLTAEASAQIIGSAKRRGLPHNDARVHVQRLVVNRLYSQFEKAFRHPARVDRSKQEFLLELNEDPAIQLAYTRMWPRLTAPELVHDLLGAMPLLRSAGRGILSADECRLLHRAWSDDPADASWTSADAPLVDEALVHLGPRRRRGVPADEIPLYGHIVVDEAQDLSPMALRMLARRSRSGSMTVVGDIAQGTGPWSPKSWGDVLAYLPEDHPPRTVELTVNYRTPREVMDLAAKVLATAAPGMVPPTSVREAGEDAAFRRVGAGELVPASADAALAHRDRAAEGTVAVIVPASMADEAATALRERGVPTDEALADLDAAVTVMPVDVVKGLEFDVVVVVEPARIVREAPQGAHALYVALTRTTKRLTIVHAEDLPPGLR